MNYHAHYDRLIARARGRALVGYRERHHVLPRCMGGGDDPENIVELTAEEHYVAHQLLVKIYPSQWRLAYAAIWMAKKCTGNKAYGWLQLRRIEAIRQIPYTADRRAKVSLAMRGKPKSASQRAKQAERMRGRTMSKEARAKVSASLIGNTRTRGTKQSAESNAKRSASMRGKTNFLGHTRSAESRAKQSASSRGRRLPPRTLEHRAKLRAAKLGSTHTAEARAKMSAASRAYWHSRRQLTTP